MAGGAGEAYWKQLSTGPGPSYCRRGGGGEGCGGGGGGDGWILTQGATSGHVALGFIRLGYLEGRGMYGREGA